MRTVLLDKDRPKGEQAVALTPVEQEVFDRHMAGYSDILEKISARITNFSETLLQHSRNGEQEQQKED